MRTRDTGAVDTVIMEYGFIDNTDEAKRLKENWKVYSEDVVKAFCEYIGHPYKEPLKEEKPVDHWAKKDKDELLAAVITIASGLFAIAIGYGIFNQDQVDALLKALKSLM
ncbi:hypothetical protein AYJ08_00655 [Brevibacillus sp. SKDU10]|uniref:hypothetical protein n=1 Tax=Brevibacillus sp. SKDU10 TaxID=1247872 RepID=UPI0007C8E551|nr:hypothetical protein [Brevibacillus sp. SKDU10]OAJ73823.1 hypothetical protein AYJ08_00655 [Brevibacillus sp. SKDU10]